MTRNKAIQCENNLVKIGVVFINIKIKNHGKIYIQK